MSQRRIIPVLIAVPTAVCMMLFAYVEKRWPLALPTDLFYLAAAALVLVPVTSCVLKRRVGGINRRG